MAELRARYPSTPTKDVAVRFDRPLADVCAKAAHLGLAKTAAYLASPAACRFRRGSGAGVATRFQKGGVPANKGLRRPGWHRGRMRETWFKPGAPSKRWDPAFHVLGALRVNTDGYIVMRVSFAVGAAGWRALHRILWEDAHGPIPAGYVLRFRNGDKLDVELANLELTTHAEIMRQNTIHRMPDSIRVPVQLLGQLKRRIRERRETVA